VSDESLFLIALADDDLEAVPNLPHRERLPLYVFQLVKYLVEIADLDKLSADTCAILKFLHDAVAFPLLDVHQFIKGTVAGQLV
jgi:hypothetical protein